MPEKENLKETADLQELENRVNAIDLEESEVVPKETAESGEEEKPEVKTFTQEELDEIIEKRLARERRKQERMKAVIDDLPPLQIDSQLNPDDFSTTEEYIDALSKEKAEAIIAHREKTQSISKIEENYQDQVDAALEKYPDYIQVAHTHQFMNDNIAMAIKQSDVAAELAYYLGSNLDDAKRIFNLSPIQQIKELGKLEVKLMENPPEDKISKAPAPIKPVNKGQTKVTTYDTTDPRSASQMTASEWIAKDRARRGFKA